MEIDELNLVLLGVMAYVVDACRFRFALEGEIGGCRAREHGPLRWNGLVCQLDCFRYPDSYMVRLGVK